VAVSYSADIKDVRMDAAISGVDASGAGSLEIGTSGMSTVLLSVPLQHPSFSRASGVITLLGVPLTANASNSGNAAAARFKNGAGAVKISGLTVGTSGADVIINTVSIVSGQPVTVQSCTITHSA
jgi:hypothetical protein